VKPQQLKSREIEILRECLILKRDTKDGGTVAGNTRRDIETRSSTRVISQDNFLSQKKRLILFAWELSKRQDLLKELGLNDAQIHDVIEEQRALHIE
jgi:hypothetical protein